MGRSHVLLLTVILACGGPAGEPGVPRERDGVPLPSPSLSPDGPPFPTLGDYFGPGEYASRRRRLGAEIGDGVVLLLGSKEPVDTREERRFDPYYAPQEFKQTEAVIYLTGVQEPAAVLLLQPRRSQLTVYLPDPDPTARQRLAALGIEELRPLSRFEEDAAALVAANPPFYLLQRNGPDGFQGARPEAGEGFSKLLPSLSQGTMPEDLVVARFRAAFPGAEVRNLLPPLQRTWKLKSAAELRLMRDVTRISVAGLLQGLRRLRPGMSERQLAGWIEGQMRRHGAQRLAYSADIQSGPNSLLSYVQLFRDYDKLDRIMQAGEIVLVDHSAEFNYYQSDIARTVPVDGRFSPEFRALYELHLLAHRGGLAGLRPGVSWAQVGQTAAAAVAERLPALPPDWLRRAAERFVERYRGEDSRPGHFLGTNLRIHDDSRSPLVPGQVMAYEMVMEAPEMGLRTIIEDTVAITPEGYENFSSELPTDVDEIERIVGKER